MDWQTSPAPVPYLDALEAMQAHAAQMIDGAAPERVWLLEHPPIYTAGSSAQASDLTDPRFPVYDTGRGGQYTYHGPGQRIAYVMLDLNRRGRDLRRHVWNLEEWAIRALGDFGVRALRRDGRVGLWVPRPDGSGVDDKIAAIGVRVRKWVTTHGIAINVSPDLSHYSGIVPCGIRDHGVTSLAALGKAVTLADMDAALKRHWDAVFGS